MGERMKSILGAAVVGGGIAYLGTELLFYPAMEAAEATLRDIDVLALKSLESSGNSFIGPDGSVAFEWAKRTPILSSPWDLIVYMIIAVVFFDAFVQKVGNAMVTAMLFATSQILILDVFYVLNGVREVKPAVLSVIILGVSWYAIGWTYNKLA